VASLLSKVSSVDYSSASPSSGEHRGSSDGDYGAVQAQYGISLADSGERNSSSATSPPVPRRHSQLISSSLSNSGSVPNE
jgi:hypothetical protein